VRVHYDGDRKKGRRGAGTCFQAGGGGGLRPRGWTQKKGERGIIKASPKGKEGGENFLFKKAFYPGEGETFPRRKERNQRKHLSSTPHEGKGKIDFLSGYVPWGLRGQGTRKEGATAARKKKSVSHAQERLTVGKGKRGDQNTQPAKHRREKKKKTMEPSPAPRTARKNLLPRPARQEKKKKKRKLTCRWKNKREKGEGGAENTPLPEYPLLRRGKRGKNEDCGKGVVCL